MAHFAKVENNIVTRVIVAEAEFFDSFVDDSAGEWIQTSYHTRGGAHSEGGTPLRKNFAGVGYTYDKEKDAFIAPKPFNSWVLNNTTFQWEAPVEKPDDGNLYVWNETDQQWDEVS